MLKKSMKIVCLLLAIMMVFTLTSTVFATNVDLDKDSNPIKTTDDGKWVDWEPGAYDKTTASSSVSKMSNAILSVVQVVGIAVAVIMLVVLAIKYISAAPSDKAEIKKHAVVYVVGAVVLFAASGILGIIRSFAGNIG